MSIDTWTEQGETLRKFATDRKVLEIGAWKGISTINMAEVAKEVWTIDNFINRWSDEDIEAIFRENVQKSGLSDKIKLLVGDSERVLDELMVQNQQFDFIFVDGGHESPVVNQDSQRACVLVKSDGYIAWHDIGYPPVAAAIRQVVSRYGLTKVEQDGILEIYRK